QWITPLPAREPPPHVGDWRSNPGLGDYAGLHQKMDMPAGPTFVSGSSEAGNAELSNGSVDFNKTAATPVHSATARFHIRSAKERQRILEPSRGLKKVSGFEEEATENVSRGSNTGRKEVIRVRPPSPKRSPGALSQVSVTKNTELPSGTSNATPGKPDCGGSQTTRVRGRTAWREANLVNRSKSLDLRGSDREKDPVVSRDTRDFKRSPRIRSESFEEPGNSPKSKEPASPSSSVSLRIQAFNAIGQGKQDNFSTVLSGSSSLRMSRVALALERASGGQSFPARLKPKESQNSTEDWKYPWVKPGHSSPKPDHAQVLLRSQVSGPKVSEMTGNKSIQDRIGKLYRLNASEEHSDTNTRDSNLPKRYSAPVGDWFSSPDAFDSSSAPRRPTMDSMFGLPSSSSFSQWRRVSYDVERGATFPRKLSKKDGTDFKPTTDTPSVLPNRAVTNDTLSNAPGPPVTDSSKERPHSQDLTGLPSGSSDWNGTQIGEPLDLGTHSLDRARSRKNPPALVRALTTESSFSGSDSSPPSKAMHPTPHETIRKETERDRNVENRTNHLTHATVIDASPSKQPHGPQETVVSAHPKPQLSRSRTVDDERLRGSEDMFELGSLTIPRMKKEGSQDKALVPSFDSVRNTIHKFESLAQQSKTPSKALGPRRTFSVPERPKLLVSVTKSSSDKSLDEWKSIWNTESQRENAFSKSEVRDVESRPAQTTAPDKISSTMKTQSRFGYRPELPGTFASWQSSEASDAKEEMKIHMDEPDFSKATQQSVKNIKLTQENHLSAAATNEKPTGGTEVSHSDPKDLSRSQSKRSLDAGLQTQELPPSNARTPDAKTSESTRDSSSSTSVKSTPLLTNNTDSKSLSNNSGSTGTAPVQDSSSDSGAFNNIHNATRNEKVTAKVSRWIAHEGLGGNSSATDHMDDIDDDDEDDEDDEGTEREDDSDSGESSVTITSNMSQSDHRSFSVSLADLCNLGGLDYPASDGNGSKDEEKWMSRRSASLSSDISVLSSVTLLGTEELDSLLEDVRSLGDDTLQNYEDVQVVVLHKEVGRGLGFTVAGGVDQNKPVTVHRVFPCGCAAQQGSIQEGDQVLSINGTALHNSAHWEVLRTLRKARGLGMAVVVLRRGSIAETQPSPREGLQKPAGIRAGRTVRVTLTKSGADLGFSLEGGVGSSLGDKPLTVQRVFQGGPISTVFPGDELLEVQGQRLDGLRRLEAWNLIKRLPPGPVDMLLHRPHLPR
ncbi:hypothetical protein NFI96_019597, partial [Prochilodus magdalenae]